MNSPEILSRTLAYLAAAVVAAPIAKRLGLGSVLGYIIAGAVIGPSALSLIGDPTEVGHVAEFGVVMLMFLIGLEMRPSLLWQLRSAIFGLGIWQMLLSASLMTAIGLVLGLAPAVAAAVSLILAMSSTALVLSTLEEKGQRAQPIGQACFGVLLFQDLSVIPLFLILPMLAARNVPSLASDPLAAWRHAGAVLLALAIVVLAGRFAVRPLFRFIASTRSREVFTAAALLLVVAVAALMTAVGLSPALGAFTAGVILAETEFRRELESDIEPFRGLLLGLFFMTVGGGLDIGLVMQHLATILGIAAAMMLAKTIAMFLTARIFRHRPQEAGAIAVALCQGGEFAFVLISFAKSQSILPPTITALLPPVIAVSMLLSPIPGILYALFAPRAGPPTEPRGEDAPFETEPDVIVAGFGRFGQIAGRLLQANGHRLSIMDSDLRQIELLRRFGRLVSFGDATRLDLLRVAGAETAKLLIVAIDDPDQSLKLVETARASFPHLVILARAWDRRHAWELLERGAHHVESETYESSLRLGREALTRLGHRAHRAHRAASLFRMHDRALFLRNRPHALDDKGFMHASRKARDSLEDLLSADTERDLDARSADEEWGTRSLYRELKGEAHRPASV